MQRKSRENIKIKEFIIREVDNYPKNIASITAAHFGISRVTANQYLQKLIATNLLTAVGKTKSRQYELNDFINEKFCFTTAKDTQEDIIWREKLYPFFKDVKKNVLNICEYGVTEMINNVIDHSKSELFSVGIIKNAKRIHIVISDQGVGIFEKIRIDCNLNDPRHALLELSKGKLTTDPKHHSGEGIFFTSRMFNEFSILSGELFYDRTKDQDDWLVEVNNRSHYTQGTLISLKIDLDTTYTAKEIFDKYSDDDFRFTKTHVPVRLARYENEQMISRSQAKRVLARFEKFTEIILDFNDVQQIGQGFADEIFRVFKNEHPEINIIYINATESIEEMIKHVQQPH